MFVCHLVNVLPPSIEFEDADIYRHNLEHADISLNDYNNLEHADIYIVFHGDGLLL